jgi:hypothetical protein
MHMLLLTHVIIAISSIMYTAYLLVRTSKKRLQASYILCGLTLITGTALVWTSHSPLVPACVSGLVYFGFISSVVIAARKKLLKSSITS